MGDQIRYTPRWLHGQVVIPAGQERPISAATFANTEIWPLRLYWLSAVSMPMVKSLSGDYVADLVARVWRNVDWQIGISQMGDINLQWASTEALMGRNFRLQQLESETDVGLRFRFPIPVSLPKDNGIVAQAENTLHLPPFFLDPEKRPIYYPAININGYYEARGDRPLEPAQIIGYGSNTLLPGVSEQLNHADLYNNGQQEMMLHEMILAAQSRYPTGDNMPDPTTPWGIWPGTAISWRINPTSGPKWMPRPKPIPAGCIAPWNRLPLDIGDLGPRAYTFPEDTILHPRRRVGIRLRNRDAIDHTIDICLFGLMEVQ